MWSTPALTAGLHCFVHHLTFHLRGSVIDGHIRWKISISTLLYIFIQPDMGYFGSWLDTFLSCFFLLISVIVLSFSYRACHHLRKVFPLRSHGIVKMHMWGFPSSVFTLHLTVVNKVAKFVFEQKSRDVEMSYFLYCSPRSVNLAVSLHRQWDLKKTLFTYLYRKQDASGPCCL